MKRILKKLNQNKDLYYLIFEAAGRSFIYVSIAYLSQNNTGVNTKLEHIIVLGFILIWAWLPYIKITNIMSMNIKKDISVMKEKK